MGLMIVSIIEDEEGNFLGIEIIEISIEEMK